MPYWQPAAHLPGPVHLSEQDQGNIPSHTCFWVHAGTKARLRSKHNLLATLVERVRDSSAYTRARVLQTWGHLAEASAIPLGHWVCVTELAVGALPSHHRSS